MVKGLKYSNQSRNSACEGLLLSNQSLDSMVKGLKLSNQSRNIACEGLLHSNQYRNSMKKGLKRSNPYRNLMLNVNFKENGRLHNSLP